MCLTAWNALEILSIRFMSVMTQVAVPEKGGK